MFNTLNLIVIFLGAFYYVAGSSRLRVEKEIGLDSFMKDKKVEKFPRLEQSDSKSSIISKYGRERKDSQEFLKYNEDHLTQRVVPDVAWNEVVQKCPYMSSSADTDDSGNIAHPKKCPFVEFASMIIPEILSKGISHANISSILGLKERLPIPSCDNSIWQKVMDGEYNGQCPFLQKVSDRPSWILPRTVPNIDLKAYSGVYFQTHASAIPLATYEKDKFCITANYGEPKNSSLLGIFDAVPTMSVEYSGNKGGPKGERGDGMHATAWQFDKKRAPGKLVVTQDDDFHIGQLRIIRVGPLNKDGKYEYVAKTDLSGTSLFIIARNPKKFREMYQKDLFENLAEDGFDKNFNKPIPTYQGYDCDFPQYVYDAYPIESRSKTAEEGIF